MGRKSKKAAVNSAQKIDFWQKIKNFWNWGDPAKVLLVSLLLVSIFFAVKYSYIAYYRVKYDRIGNDLVATLDDIKKETGEPAKWRLTKDCGYASAKFSRGRLGCGIDVDFVYNVSSDREANELLSRVIKNSEKSDFKLTSYSAKESPEFVNDGKRSDLQTFSYKYRGNLESSCALSAEFGKLDSEYTLTDEQGPLNLSISLGCGQTSLIFPFYQVTKN